MEDALWQYCFVRTQKYGFGLIVNWLNFYEQIFGQPEHVCETVVTM